MEKMNLQKTLAVAVLLFAFAASAEENYVTKYTCNNADNSTLSVFHKYEDTSGKKALVHLTVKGEVKVYEATYELTPTKAFSLENYEYQLFQGDSKVGSLKVTTQQKVGRGGGFCGRAGCDFPPPATIPVYLTFAAIQIGEYEDSFDCN